MLSAYVLIETEVGKVAHVGQALTKLDGVQLAEDLVGVGPKQQPVLEGGGLPLGGIADRIAGARTDGPNRPPLLTGRESSPAAAAEPASCYLLDHRNRPGGQGGLEPASSSGGLVVAEGSRHQVQKGHGGSLRLPTPFPERPKQPLQSAGHRPVQPGKPPIAGRQRRWRTRTAQGVSSGRLRPERDLEGRAC